MEIEMWRERAREGKRTNGRYLFRQTGKKQVGHVVRTLGERGGGGAKFLPDCPLSYCCRRPPFFSWKKNTTRLRDPFFGSGGRLDWKKKEKHVDEEI